MNTQITITTLGNFFIEENGSILADFVSNKTMLLLLYLRLNPRPHTRANLASLFWSETSDSQALKNLRTILSSLRAELPDFIKQEANTIVIQAKERIGIDVEFFSEQADEVLCLLEKQAYQQVQSAKIEAILKLYQGDFLSSVSIRNASNLELWVQKYEEILKEKHSRLLYHFVQFLFCEQDYEKALFYARQLVQKDPLWEAAQRQLMLIYEQVNRRNDALNQFENLQKLLADELGAEPEAETQDIYERMRLSTKKIMPLQTAIPQITLSSDLIFVKPERDYDYLERLFQTAESRLLSLIGIAGLGKTFLASQIAASEQKHYRDGALFVSLDAIQHEDDLARLILEKLALSPSHNKLEAQKRLVEYFAEREFLLVLDGYEHLLPSTKLLRMLLKAAPKLRVMVTSRSALGIPEEWMIPLKGLRLPNKNQVEMNCEALRLFQAQAQRALPEFQLGDVLAEVSEICRFVDGLPLAIVILATWVRHFSTEKILEMLLKDIRQFYSLVGNRPAHHQEFGKLIDSSLGTLSKSEKDALVALSIFPDSFSHEAALAVANIPMLDFVKLLEKSLIQRSNKHRYKLHKLIQRECRKHLDASSSLCEVQERFKNYFTDGPIQFSLFQSADSQAGMAHISPRSIR